MSALASLWLLHVCFLRGLLQSPPSDTHADWLSRRHLVVFARLDWSLRQRLVIFGVLDWSAIWSDSGLNIPFNFEDLSCTVSHVLSLDVGRSHHLPQSLILSPAPWSVADGLLHSDL
jgi:hypothetical protein